MLTFDNRIGMDENGTQTWTLYDGSTPIMDFKSSGSLEMRYLIGPTGDLVDTVIARESSGGTIEWYLPDRLGTVRDLISNLGSIIDHVDYSAFGTVLDESDPSEGDRMMGFAGMERDTVTGLNLAVNRVQNPGTGRWASQDPLGFAAGDADLYGYADNDPQNSADPSGLQAQQATTCIPGNFKPKKGWWYRNPTVQTAIDLALGGSYPGGVFNHEEGGWIYYNPATGTFQVDPFQPGKPPKPGQNPHMDPPPPKPPPGFCTVGSFHTHRDHTHAGPKDQHFLRQHNVPLLIVVPGEQTPYYPPIYPGRLQ
jgi:RHS repeat-associated protein